MSNAEQNKGTISCVPSFHRFVKNDSLFDRIISKEVKEVYTEVDWTTMCDVDMAFSRKPENMPKDKRWIRLIAGAVQ